MQLPIMPQKQPIAVTSLAGPAPTIQPNTNINPATGLAFEGRTRAHQAPALGFPFPPPVIHQVSQQAGQANMSNQLPLQTIWGFDGISPGPTYVERYGSPVLVRNFNNLPSSNGGFGNPSVSTHLHNGHTPSESDGFPCDFFAQGQYYDQYYPNVLAGFNSDHKPPPGQPITAAGDINEAMSTLWYHDHRVDFTSQNVYSTDLNNLGANNQFWQISNDGNLLPTPVQVPAVQMGVAERADVIIDFSQFAGKTIYLENRLEQVNGRGPTGNLLAAGQGNLLLQIVVHLPAVADQSAHPPAGPTFYCLPDPNLPPVVT